MLIVTFIWSLIDIRPANCWDSEQSRHMILFKQKYRISYTATQPNSAGVKAPARVKLTLRGIAEHSDIPSMTAPPEKLIMSDLNDERLFWY